VIFRDYEVREGNGVVGGSKFRSCSTLALEMWIYATYLRFKIHAIPQHVLSPLLVQLFQVAMVDFAEFG
jgi:hypothetical protein